MASELHPVVASPDSVGSRDAFPLLSVRDLRVYFPVLAGVLRRRKGWVKVVDGVSVDVYRGETLGLVGESGSGKTTLARTVMRTVDPVDGTIHLDGVDILQLRGSSLRQQRRQFQLVFQDPQGSLNARHNVAQILSEPLRVHGLGEKAEYEKRATELLALVGLRADFLHRYPHELSGGQQQRVAIARAMAVEPELIVFDEALSSLDVSVQAQIIKLLRELQHQRQVSYLFIAHDLAVVRYFADRIAVMYLGKIVEHGPSETLCERPLHPYTQALLSAAPIPDPRIEARRKRIILKGDLPDPANPPQGCRFSTRCWLRNVLDNPEICVTTEPRLMPTDGGNAKQESACHFSAKMAEASSTEILESGRQVNK